LPDGENTCRVSADWQINGTKNKYKTDKNVLAVIDPGEEQFSISINFTSDEDKNKTFFHHGGTLRNTEKEHRVY
jgi:hypothetical protein